MAHLGIENGTLPGVSR